MSLVYALWALLIVHLTVSAIGVKEDTETHLGQSLAVTIAIIAAFVLRRLPMFAFVGQYGSEHFRPPAVRWWHARPRLGAAAFGEELEPNGRQQGGARVGHLGPLPPPAASDVCGGLIACIGSAIVCGGAFVILPIVLEILFLWRVGAQDALMARQFPNPFSDYKRRTRALLAWLW
jgi:protein-S-isoprenylcysteine O-methyltransferase